jgi:hypothetical protein
MNLDTLKRGQVTVQDATIVAGQEPKWSRQRGTKLRVHASRVHPRVRDIQININGSMVYFATDWDPKAASSGSVRASNQDCGYHGSMAGDSASGSSEGRKSQACHGGAGGEADV